MVRIIEHSEISETVDAMTRLLKLSGFCGFDFIIDACGAAYLIDFNPRATQTCHLTSKDSKQPVAHLAAKLRGLSVADATERYRPDPIVLFPHGHFLPTNSPYLAYGESDVPTASDEFAEIGRVFRRQRNRVMVKAAELLVRRLGL